jgi:diguanylate cyclase (GGDEF)-like protein
MTSPVRVEREASSSQSADTYSPPRRTAVTVELPAISTELGEALRAEQASLHRDVLLWQRWIRYLAIGTLVLLSLVFGSAPQAPFIPLVLVAAGYVLVVMGTSWVLGRSETNGPVRVFAPLLIAADIAALAGFCYLTSSPAELHRILLLGFLSMQLGVFYFGRAQGTLAAVLTIGAYLLFTLGVPAFVPGRSPTPMTVAFNVTLFAIISTVLVYTLGSFRERMDALRAYCSVAEQSETAALPALPSERWPDELTLLVRRFQSMHARLAEQVGSDSLTACLNRRAFETQLRSDLRQARRREATVAIAAVDLDNFKEINDTHGHQVGDLVLQQVARIMMQTARDTDAVARYGGDEFVVVLPDTGWQGALTFADRLRRRVDEYTFGPTGSPIAVTISVGVALARGSDPMSTEALLQEADAALYRAKTAGRNRVFS